MKNLFKYKGKDRACGIVQTMKIQRKKIILTIIIVLCLASLAGCGDSSRKTGQPSDPDSQINGQNHISSTKDEAEPEDGLSADDGVKPEESSSPEDNDEPELSPSLIDPDGMTVETRILPPEGYSRTTSEAGSLTEYLRSYALKEDKSPVLLYNGRKKGNQNAHQAVLTLPIEDIDLQQCADSIMRIYAEYYYSTGQPERIAFHFTNGFLAEYTRWRDGERISVNGNDVQWVPGGAYDDSYETFTEYMKIVFCYAGTLSMASESSEISLAQAEVGDVFIKGGSPGHVVMIIDVCENPTGGRAFLLAQGYMPAQEFHILKNPMHEDDCWYYEEEISFPLHTPEYVFDEHSLCRLEY